MSVLSRKHRRYQDDSSKSICPYTNGTADMDTDTDTDRPQLPSPEPVASAHVSKKRKTCPVTTCLSQLSLVSVYAQDVMESVLYPLLTFAEYFRLACTCHALRPALGIHPSVMRKSRGWCYLVVPPKAITNKKLDYLCSFALLRELDLSNCLNITGEGLAPLQKLPLTHLVLRGVQTSRINL
jgi:hypothetical protein